MIPSDIMRFTNKKINQAAMWKSIDGKGRRGWWQGGKKRLLSHVVRYECL
jgi:hypothetical protein